MYKNIALGVVWILDVLENIQWHPEVLHGRGCPVKRGHIEGICVFFNRRHLLLGVFLSGPLGFLI